MPPLIRSWEVGPWALALRSERQHQAARDTSLLPASFIELQVEEVQPEIGAHAHGPDQPLRPGEQRAREAATNVEEVTSFNQCLLFVKLSHVSGTGGGQRGRAQA